MNEEQRLRNAQAAITRAHTTYAELGRTLDAEGLTLSQQINTLSEMRKCIELIANLDGTLRIAGMAEEGGH
jgi:hypothetical protein